MIHEGYLHWLMEDDEGHLPVQSQKKSADETKMSISDLFSKL